MRLLKKQYPGLSFAENFFGGHMNLGPVTIYGENAMHWGVNIETRHWGYICFRLPVRCFDKWWPLYFYVSPNATPWASTFYRGEEKRQRRLSVVRRKKYGHNFDSTKLSHDVLNLETK